jgi:hypothetical protein
MKATSVIVLVLSFIALITLAFSLKKVGEGTKNCFAGCTRKTSDKQRTPCIQSCISSALSDEQSLSDSVTAVEEIMQAIEQKCTRCLRSRKASKCSLYCK